jgi:hypothetical protein
MDESKVACVARGSVSQIARICLSRFTSPRSCYRSVPVPARTAALPHQNVIKSPLEQLRERRVRLFGLLW